MSRPRATAAVAVVAACAAALTGCQTQHEIALRSPTVPVHVGGVLRVGVTSIGSVDPGDAYEPSGRLIATTMCDSLLSVDPRTGALRPGLAESWEVSNSGTRISLSLRDGLRFSDGAKLTADDVVFSLSRVASADYAGHQAAMLAPIQGYEVVHGDTPTSNSSAKRTLTGLRALDDHSVQITLAHADAQFAAVLAEPLAAPVERAAVERDPDAFARQPVCVGPYRLAAPWHGTDSSVTLVRTPGYRATTSVYTRGGAGYADRIQFRVYPDAKAATDGWARGQVDVTGVPVDLAAAVARRSRSSLVTAPGPYLEYVGLPTSVPPYSDPAVRRALSVALDRTALARTGYDGFRLPAAGFVPPTLGLPASMTTCTSVPATPDPAAARAEWSRLPAAVRSKPLVLTVNDDGANVALAHAVARQWHQVLGLRVTVRITAWSTMLATMAQTAPTTAFRFGWQGRYAGVDDYLAPLFTSDGIGTDNLNRFHDPALDDLLDRQARSADDEKDRLVDYANALERVCADLPLIPVLEGEGKALVRGARVGSAVAPQALGKPWAQPLLRELYLR